MDVAVLNFGKNFLGFFQAYSFNDPQVHAEFFPFAKGPGNDISPIMSFGMDIFIGLIDFSADDFINTFHNQSKEKSAVKYPTPNGLS